MCGHSLVMLGVGWGGEEHSEEQLAQGISDITQVRWGLRILKEGIVDLKAEGNLRLSQKRTLFLS